MIKLQLKVSGRLTQIETMAESLQDLELPLQQWNKYKRKDVQGIFDAGGPGWPKTESGGGSEAGGRSSPESVKKRADAVLRIKLRAELRRAQRRHARGKGNESKSAATVARRYAVLKAFEQLAAGEKLTADLGDAKLAKSVTGLRDRMHRATSKAAGRPLGRIASSIKSKVEKHTVTIYSTIPWAGAHNDGATVGRGAQLPERKFLDVTEQDKAVLLMLITMYVQGKNRG